MATYRKTPILPTDSLDLFGTSGGSFPQGVQEIVGAQTPGDTNSYPISIPSEFHNMAPFRMRVNLPDFLKQFRDSGDTSSVYSSGKYTTYDSKKIQDTYNKQKAKLEEQAFNKSRLDGMSDYFKKLVTPPTEDKLKERNARGSTDNSILPDPVTLADMVFQIQAIESTPDLTLLINPKSFDLSYSKIQQHQEFVRTGTVFQSLLGEELPKLSCSGQIGAYVASNRNPELGANAPGVPGPDGVSYFSKRDSLSFQNFISIFNFYLNNGYIYDLVGRSRANHYIGYISIFWDGKEYQGTFESFNYSYTETAQNGGLEYDFSFVVSKILDAE